MRCPSLCVLFVSKFVRQLNPPQLVRLLISVCLITLAVPSLAHDAKRTEVILSFERDGSFILDVANDLNWLRARLPAFSPDSAASPPVELTMQSLGSVFIDRVVLWVDGHEIRPTSAEYINPHSESALRIYRLRGRMPSGSRTLRWYYGLVIDPYPLTIRRSDGRTFVETVYGDAWSSPIDISGQFLSPMRVRFERLLPILGLLLLVALAIAARLMSPSSIVDGDVGAPSQAAGGLRRR